MNECDLAPAPNLRASLHLQKWSIITTKNIETSVLHVSPAGSADVPWTLARSRLALYPFRRGGGPEPAQAALASNTVSFQGLIGR